MTSPGRPLTPKQRQALRLIAARPGAHSVWDFGSTTINYLRKLGLITTRSGRCYPAGHRGSTTREEP